MFNNQIWRILTQKCSPCKNSRQITANAKIHGKRQNSWLPWIPWIRDFRLALVIDVDKSKKPVTSACYDKQNVCTYLQPFSH